VAENGVCAESADLPPEGPWSLGCFIALADHRFTHWVSHVLIRPYGPKSREHSPGLPPHKRKIIMAFGWENGFVPEGQADRSQARSAWVPMQRGSRPGGTVEVVVSPI
jgi:hypothetical protein